MELDNVTIKAYISLTYTQTGGQIILSFVALDLHLEFP